MYGPAGSSNLVHVGGSVRVELLNARQNPVTDEDGEENEAPLTAVWDAVSGPSNAAGVNGGPEAGNIAVGAGN